MFPHHFQSRGQQTISPHLWMLGEAISMGIKAHTLSTRVVEVLSHEWRQKEWAMKELTTILDMPDVKKTICRKERWKLHQHAGTVYMYLLTSTLIISFA